MARRSFLPQVMAEQPKRRLAFRGGAFEGRTQAAAATPSPARMNSRRFNDISCVLGSLRSL
jgi:hypothetical protein